MKSWSMSPGIDLRDIAVRLWISSVGWAKNSHRPRFIPSYAPSYAPATRCPVLTSRIVLPGTAQVRLEIPKPDRAESQTVLRRRRKQRPDTAAGRKRYRGTAAGPRGLWISEAGGEQREYSRWSPLSATRLLGEVRY
eukprot:2757991-Rhodomonas_salina.1